MSIRSVGSISLPKSSAGHLGHLNVIGLETFVDRTNANHARRCDGQLIGESLGADKCDEQRRHQASKESRTDPVNLTHENSPPLRLTPADQAVCLEQTQGSELDATRTRSSR